ncbi:MAG: hypothetical protein GTO41_18055, partial [Burkholderiales bacterium]|nr:hypothetical protein [Burkholderiales bacterium]
MSMHLLADHSLCLTQLGEALSLAGRFDEAEKVAQHALQRAQEYGE